MRLNKYLADKNIASRREADTLIASGKVFVNGKKAMLGTQVTETDRVEVRGATKEYVYFAYNKPTGIVTSTPQKGEIDIMHATKFPTTVFPIGRLDKDSHGLIIMTNDGRVTKKLLDPAFAHEKEYEVLVDKPIAKEFLRKMSQGVTITTNKDVAHHTKQARVTQLGDCRFSIVLTEGKNRQIRRMCEELGYHVRDLKRVRIGKIRLGNLKLGTYKKIAL